LATIAQRHASADARRGDRSSWLSPDARRAIFAPRVGVARSGGHTMSMPNTRIPTAAPVVRPPLWWLRWVLFGLILVGIVLAYVLLPLKDWIMSAKGLLQGLGVLGVVAFIGSYLLFCVLLLPAALMSILAGAAWPQLGGLAGFAVALPSATIAACAAFLIARYFFSGRFRAWLMNKPRLAAIERAVYQKGAALVFLLRLSPMLPFPVLNYVFGLTLIPFHKYALATFFGMMPITFMWTYVGSVGSEMIEGNAEIGTAKIVMGVVSGLITLAVTIWVGRAARQAMREAAESPVPGARRSAAQGA